MRAWSKDTAELAVMHYYYAKYDARYVDAVFGNTVAGTFFDNGADILSAFTECLVTASQPAQEEGKLVILVDANLDAQRRDLS